MDGGTPRDLARIKQIGTAEYEIRAAVEEVQSPLKHAVSRIELICRNSSSQSVNVTLHLDLSGDGQRTDLSSPSGGMALRDFVFIQPPGQSWQQIDGNTKEWIATLKFPAAPGETKVGLSPWYSYADYLAFVRDLPAHPHLKKSVIARSDGGRELWELTITDPRVGADRKRTIFWHAREHSYETFSSFAMEGLVAFLLSDAAADIRRRFVFTLHPMTNIDGVAQGHEYRVGYDYPNPAEAAIGRATFAAIDRLRPDFAVTWHNWVAPRDRDVVFYTDGDQGKPTSRAWYLFAQNMLSPHATGHRWMDELNPSRPNWQGRPLGLTNLHQYAMKKYGTRIWGWEMPWWRRTPDYARDAGARFAQAFLATITDLDRDRKLPAPAATVEVPRWQQHEFVLPAAAHVSNPFADAALVGVFTSPSGKSQTVDGFYDGGDTWRLRFAPDEEGTWTYILHGEGVEAFQHGQLICTAARSHGFIRINPANPFSFISSDGTPFFPMGDTCYGLFDDSPITPALRADYLKTRRAQHFNFVRLQVCGSPSRASADPNYWAWGGTPEKPDLDRFNPEFFRRFDALLREMQAAGMNAELILLNFYRRPFTDPALWTPAREQRWLRYLVARYGAFENIFLWTIANEYETHPDGKYRLDNPGDPDWAKATARYIKSQDAYRHLVTVHPVMPATTKGTSTRDGFDPPWRIGEFFGPDDAIDVISQQTGKSGEGVVWDEQLQCWTGDAVTLVPSLRADLRYGKPVLNTENGYEYLRGYPTGRRQVHHTDMVRRTAWRIVCSGGYFAAGFRSTLGHSDSWNRLDPANHYSFILKDEGAGRQLAILYEFFAALPFAQLRPLDDVTGNVVALALGGQRYVVYFPHGGSAQLVLPAAPGGFRGHWLNPRTGESAPAFDVEGGRRVDLKAPDSLDWALDLHRADGH